jgi:hypothetical protein
MKRLLPSLVLPFLLCPHAAPAGDAVRAWIEYATDLAGPWTKIDLATVRKDPAGNPILPHAPDRTFFRTQIQLVPGGAGFTLPLDEVPEETRGRAESMLKDGKTGREPWPDDCTLSPEVYPVYDKAHNGGQTPAMLEFKVLRQLPPPAGTGFPLTYVEDCIAPDAGSLFISLTDNEQPQGESSQTGKSITEKLWELAGRRDVKIFRFGGDFFTAEDMTGNLVANFGTQPWKPDPALATELRAPLVWEGDDELGTDSRPVMPAEFTPQFYDGYIHFCNDYLTNPVYQKLRQRRAVRARMEWNLERGVLPQTLVLGIGEEQTILPGETITEISFENEEGSKPVRTLPGTDGLGLTVTGAAPGHGILHVMHGSGGGGGAGITSFVVQVGGPAVAPRGSFTPGWQTVAEYIVGEGAADQVRYKQMKSPEWPGFVGCGPHAWAMLLAWFERERGLTAAFGDFVDADSPWEYYSKYDPSSSAHFDLKPVVHSLRSNCGTFDDPFSDNSPTMPGEMPDGVLQHLNFQFLSQMLKRSWKARWSDLFQTLNGGGGATEVRDAITSGRCACVGLGNYWHYGVAYAYRRQHYILTPGGPPLYTRRQFKVNMGWGGGDGNWVWRDFYDTFFSMNLNLKKGPLHP